MTTSQNYNDGQVSLTNGSTMMVGIATAWQLALVTGGLLLIEGQPYTAAIQNVTSDTQAELSLPWSGTTGTFDYTIFRETAQSTKGTEANDRLAQISYKYWTGTFLQPDASGTLAQRAAYDDVDPDPVFIYVRDDVVPFLIYMKRSATHADWSAGTALVGPAGSPGAPGINGIGDKYSIGIHDPGRAGAAEVIAEYILDATVAFPLNFAGSFSKAGIAATATAVWSIRKNGVQVGTITYAAAGTTGTFAGAAVSFIAGDIFSVVAPSPRDATLSNVKHTLSGNR